jgi:hypothetical protein
MYERRRGPRLMYTNTADDPTARTRRLNARLRRTLLSSLHDDYQSDRLASEASKEGR